MAITLLPDGSIKTDTVDEFLALKKRLDAGKVAPAPSIPAEVAVSASRKTAFAASPVDPRIEITETFLRVLASDKDRGVSADVVQKSLGVSKPRGMGGKMQAIKGVLNRAGFADPDQIFLWERTPIGPVWKAGPKLGDALQKISTLGAKTE